MTANTIDAAMAATGGMVNGFDPARMDGLEPGMRGSIERRQRVLGQAYKLFYDRPVRFVRGEGVFLYDEAGEAYLDVYNNVPSVGHCHPRVVEAVSRQLGTLNTHTRYLHDGLVDYAEDLLGTFPDGLDRVMFTCTGSEAADLALRIARYHTGAHGFVVTENAYHGHTTAASEVSPSMGRHVALSPSTRVVPAPDAYRGGDGMAGAFAADVERAIADMRRHGIRFAGFIADSIFSSDGVFVGPPGFLGPVRDLVRREGGLFVADEVQPGFARTGEAMWGFQRHGIVPDMVVLGKPMGNGMPIGGVVTRADLVEAFGRETRYFNTFAGSPACIAAAHAVLGVIRDEALQVNALSVGAELTAGLRELATRYPLLGDVRGAGLFVGADIVSDRDTKAPAGAACLHLVNALRERRVLISASGKRGNVLKIRPPLSFSSEHCALFLGRFEECLRELPA